METAFRYYKLSCKARIILAAFFYLGCILLQILLDCTYLSMLLVIPAWVVLKTRVIENKPKDLGKEEWRAVSDAEIIKIADYLTQSKKLQRSLSGPQGLKVFLVIAIGLPSFFLAYHDPHAVVVFDALLFLIPGFFFGGVKLFIPPTFLRKLPGFMAIMNTPRGKDLVLTPYLRFDQDKEKRDIPEDLRFMLEPRRKPSDLIGIQFQMTINNGQHGPVPYLYAVALTKGKTGAAYQSLSRLSAPGFHVEPGGDEEYGTVVVRQYTTGGGYHTTNQHCIKLFYLMVEALGKLPEEKA